MVKGIELEGTIIESFRGSRHTVALDSGLRVVCYEAGRLRKCKVYIVPGDKVRCELNIADPKLGRITRRL